ncbi:MAG: hypothetical protein IJ785_01145 [Bacteroidales bacterium]|nr:hypothetical protein [Bacteroidales bacterium]
MKKVLSFIGKVLCVLLVLALLGLGALQWLKEKAEASKTPQNPDMWVDLGLPSGLLWAKYNMGGTTAGETNYLYAWGDTAFREGRFTWMTYRFTEGDRKPDVPSIYASGPGDYGKLLKYCTNSQYGKNGLADNLTTLQPEDDAATVGLDKGARIPTPDEWIELFNNTTKKWVVEDGEDFVGVKGIRLTGPNGNSIFLPAAGYSCDGWLEQFGELGCYWTNALGDTEMELANSSHEVFAVMDATLAAKCFEFASVSYSSVRNVFRYEGMSVRAVFPTR